MQKSCEYCKKENLLLLFHQHAMIVNPLRIFATLFLVAVGVSGQTPDACIETCLSSSLSNDTCTSSTNTTCVCSNTAYQTAVASCLVANCTTADVATAKALQQTECGSSSNSTSNSTTASSSSKSTSSSSTRTTTTPSASGSSSSKSGAVHEQVPFLNAAFALATVALGAALLL